MKIKTDLIRVMSMECECSAGADLWRSIADAIRIAAEYEANVSLGHNARTYQVDYEALFKSIYSQHK